MSLTTGPSSGCSFRALPPEPPLALTLADENLIARANQAIGRLEGIRSTLPDAKLFTYFYVRKEAVLSAQIEGTQSSLSDLLRFESGVMPGVPLDEVEEGTHPSNHEL